MFDVPPCFDTNAEPTTAADDVPADASAGGVGRGRSRPRGRARGWARDAEVDLAALKAEADVVDAEIRELVARRRKDSVELVYALARMARGRLYRAYGFADLCAYARSREVPHSASQVKQMVTLAAQLVRLPEQRQAFQGGRLEWTKAREIAREATRRGTPEADGELLGVALKLSYHDLEREIARARGKPVKRPATLHFSEEERADVDQAALRARAAEPELSLEAAIARACRAYAQGGGGGATGDGSAAATRVVIHCAAPATATVESLLEEHVGAVVETRAGPVAVSPARLEEALCSAEVHDVRAGPARVTRTVPARTARLVHGRDGGRCKVPDCPNLGFLHIHHEPGRRAVGHDPGKMLLLCTGHHSMRHEGLLGIEALADGFRFTFADGSSRFAPLHRGAVIQAVAEAAAEVAVAEAATEVARPARSVWSSTAIGTPRPGSGTIREVVEDAAVKALVVLEVRKTEARELIRAAIRSLEGRGASIDESALVAEALRSSSRS